MENEQASVVAGSFTSSRTDDDISHVPREFHYSSDSMELEIRHFP
jgi:hypothetical protein